MESASLHEVKLVEATINSSFTCYAPDWLVGDKAYDSDSLDRQLFSKSVELKWLLRTVAVAKSPLPRMAESSGVIGADGKLSVCLPGFKTLADWLFDTNTMQRISSVWFNLAALLCHFVFLRWVLITPICSGITYDWFLLDSVRQYQIFSSRKNCRLLQHLWTLRCPKKNLR